MDCVLYDQPSIAQSWRVKRATQTIRDRRFRRRRNESLVVRVISTKGRDLKTVLATELIRHIFPDEFERVSSLIASN